MNLNHENFLFFIYFSNFWPNHPLLIALFDGIEIYGDFGQLSHPGLRSQRDFSLSLLMELVLDSLLDFVSLINEGVHCTLHSVLFTPVLQEVRKNIRRSFFICDYDGSHCGRYGISTPIPESYVSSRSLSSEFSLVPDLIHKTDKCRLELPLFVSLKLLESLPDLIDYEFSFDSLDVSGWVDNISLDLSLF